MNWVDWVILAVVVVSTFASLVRGFIAEAFSLAALVVATVAAIVFTTTLSQWLASLIESPMARTLLAFAALFIGTLIVGSIVGRLLRRLVHASGLGGIDRGLGLLFGAVRGLLIVMVVALGLALTPAMDSVAWKESKLLPYLMAGVRWGQAQLPRLHDHAG